MEIVCRAAKHLFAQYLQSVEQSYVAVAIAHFLNCFIGACQSVPAPNLGEELNGGRKKPKQRRQKSSSGGGGDNSEWSTLTPKSFWQKLKEEMDYYFSHLIDW